MAALIAVFESERLVAYQDSGGVWTIGIGSTKGVKPGDVITHEEAIAKFTLDDAPLVKMVSGLPVLEAAAYGSFGFNCGVGALRKVLAGLDTIGNPKHTTDRHGVVRGGLVTRRRLEELLIVVSQELLRPPAIQSPSFGVTMIDPGNAA